MNTTTTFALVLLLLAGTAGGLFFVLGGESGGELPPTPPNFEPASDDQPTAGPGLRVIGTGVPGEPQTNEREQFLPEESLTGSQYAQGVMGTVVDPSGTPVQGARVFLMESSMSNVFQRFQSIQTGVVFPPTASGRTDERGQFHLGLREPVAGTVFEVRITTDAYADKKIPNLTIQANDWYEADVVVLEQGATIHGSVIVEGQGVPAPGAVVYIKATGNAPDLSPTPGRENGLMIEVDETGYFQVQNAPTGVVDISAVAPYFARSEKRGLNLDPMIANEVRFELSRGLTIRGVVTDPTGAPVNGAVVMATSLLPKQPQNEEVRTGANGRFEFLSLVEAPFQLTAMARGFQRHDEKPVQAPSDDIHLVLEKQGMVQVKVWGNNGRLLRVYLLNVRSHFAAQNQIGNVQSQAPRNIRGGDLENGFATVENLNAGTYVIQIDAANYARTFSEPFTVGPGIEPASVEVYMSAGGSITGTVTDDLAQPLSGVTVQTQTNGTIENPFLTMLGQMVPKKITEIAAQTDAQGRYRFDVLAEGIYQLKFTHPSYCEEVVKDLGLEEGQITQAPSMAMVRGTLIIGTTTVDGVPAGQVKVLVQVRPDPAGQPGNPSAAVFNAETVSDSQGHYSIPRRLPPGNYQVQATRQPENPFGIIIDYEKTRRTFTVLAGQLQMRVDVNVPSR